MTADLVVGASFGLATLALLATGHRRSAALLAVVVTLVLVVVAETPFGLGNGTVPRLVGLDECDRTRRVGDRHAPDGLLA